MQISNLRERLRRRILDEVNLQVRDSSTNSSFIDDKKQDVEKKVGK